MLGLYVWGRHWGLASIDPSCLIIISYLQLLEYDEWGLIECDNPNLSPTGELPVLKDGLEWIAGVHNIIRHLKKKDLDADESLSAKQKSESLAFTSFVEENVYDALLFSWYVNSKNYTETIRPLYVKLLAFPICYVVPTQLRDAAKSRLEKYGVVTMGGSGFLVDKEQKMQKVVRESYNVLLRKIGDKEYFFDRPSTIDVVVYGHLALHLYANLQNSDLSEILKTEYPRLEQFCERMKNRLSSKSINYLPATDLPSVFTGLISSPRTWFTRTPRMKEKSEKSEAQISFERKRYISIFGAITFIIVYVFWNRIISIELDGEVNEDGNRNQDIDEEDYEESGNGTNDVARSLLISLIYFAIL
ncbi:4958_t:CDS:2 [Acaulospora morrowiae]|uniref:4958_t:CDS:1 n=1 Tax=Acaulospora morrowiae TaxID=94023 RepID=A0A9N9F1L0_9GLOM|nr:4958_t:CDS:2 [Acaulospora morrowiae]